MNILVQCELLFDDSDLKIAKKWWRKSRFSAAPDGEILLNAALDGIITPDIESSEILD